MECFKICTVSVGGDDGDTDTDGGEVTCIEETKCPDEPVRRVECDDGGCTCFLDDMAVKTCPEGACSDVGVPTVDCCEGL
jgi:hypothetical protein